jgi:hypothetical protein
MQNAEKARKRKIIWFAIILFLILSIPPIVMKRQQQRAAQTLERSDLKLQNPIPDSRIPLFSEVVPIKPISDADGLFRTKEYYLQHGNELAVKLRECRDNPQTSHGIQNCDAANKAKDL